MSLPPVWPKIQAGEMVQNQPGDEASHPWLGLGRVCKSANNSNINQQTRVCKLVCYVSAHGRAWSALLSPEILFVLQKAFLLRVRLHHPLSVCPGSLCAPSPLRIWVASAAGALLNSPMSFNSVIRRRWGLLESCWNVSVPREKLTLTVGSSVWMHHSPAPSPGKQRKVGIYFLLCFFSCLNVKCSLHCKLGSKNEINWK